MLISRLLHDHSKLIFAIAAFTVAIPAARAQYGLALSPMRVELNLAPGAQRNGSLAIANEAKAPARFRTEILDVSIDKEAVPQFEKEIPSETDYSCRKWLTVNPMESDLSGSTQMMIRYTFRVPADARPRTYHCALGFTGLSEPKDNQSPIGITALIRLTSTFYITVGNPAPAGEVSGISIEKFSAPETSGYRAVISVENAGMTNLRGAGKVDIVSETGEVVQSGDFPPVVILPNRKQRLPVVLGKKVASGSYILRARVNLGNGEIQEAELNFRLPLAE